MIGLDGPLSKPAYKPLPNKYMIKFSPWTKVDELKDVPEDFPCYVHFPTAASASALVVTARFDFFFIWFCSADVMGLIVGVSNVSYIRMARNAVDTAKSYHPQRSLRNTEVELVLWGQRAEEFDAELVYSNDLENPVVGIFVGTLMKS